MTTLKGTINIITIILEGLFKVIVVAFIFLCIAYIADSIEKEKIENKQELTEKYEAWAKLTGNPKQLTVEEFEILIKNGLLK